MSGGEQQMVAIGRAMMSAPSILMLDEPSLGLSPLLCKELFQNLAQVKSLGIGVLLVEQNAKQSLAISDRGYLLENTRITHSDSAARLASDPAVQKAYLGAGGGSRTKTPEKPSAPVAHVAREATPRRSAEEQIGVDIDALVSKAAETSAHAPRPEPSAEVQRASAALTRKTVEVVLKDIESAAKSARHRASQRRGTDQPAPTRKTEASPPPVIEVYRRPRVEVYRRRPSGSFERD